MIDRIRNIIETNIKLATGNEAKNFKDYDYLMAYVDDFMDNYVEKYISNMSKQWIDAYLNDGNDNPAQYASEKIDNLHFDNQISWGDF